MPNSQTTIGRINQIGERRCAVRQPSTINQSAGKLVYDQPNVRITRLFRLKTTRAP